MSEQKRVRWRVTKDELAYYCRATPMELEAYAQSGGLGPRWTERREQGAWRHIDRPAAQRAVLMSRLLRAGLDLETAAQIAVLHEVGEIEPLTVEVGTGVLVQVSRENLP